MIVCSLYVVACDDAVDIGSIFESAEPIESPDSPLMKSPIQLPSEPPSVVVHRELPPDVLLAMKRNAEDVSWFIERLRTDETFLSTFNPEGVRILKEFLLVEKGLTDAESIHEWQKEFYTRYIDAGGVAIVGPDTVTDREYLLAREAILVMTSKRPELRDRVQSKHGKFYMILVGDYLEASDIPEKLDPPSAAEWTGPFQAATEGLDRVRKL